MHVLRLDITSLRRFELVSMAPGPGLNLLTGHNGAGKTSVLEALHLMAYGRSFRGRVRDGLVRQGAPALEVFVEWQDASSRVHRAGLRHGGQVWEGRLDGANVTHLGELCAAFAVVSFEPGSHALVTGGSEARRRLLDWGLFHVEPAFLQLWRRYARALKQRNALLKAHAAARELDVWDYELVESGEPLTRHRRHYLGQWLPRFEAAAASLLPAGGPATLAFVPGWREELPLADALLLARERDRAMGHTSVGPHRADWRVDYRDLPGREALSRGQAKLTALALLLSQAEQHAALRGDWPVMALDDLASELDRSHQRRVLEWLVASGAQIFVTGTEAPFALGELPGTTSISRFHVEHGQLHPEAPHA
jgi:DNA replication and repair protein RecF